MAKNPEKQAMQVIGINIPETMAKDIERRARSMHISKSKYCLVILQRWLESDQKLTLSE